jgi:hypothetical protein
MAAHTSASCDCRDCADTGDMWYLADVLSAELRRRGYAEVPEYGWQGRDSEETAWLYALFKTADAMDAEFRRLESDMRRRQAPIRSWAVLREGGPAEGDDAAEEREEGEVDEEDEVGDEGQEGGEASERGEQAEDKWLDDRILMQVFAYNEAHAVYLLLLDFTQPPSKIHPPAYPFPPDYSMGVVEVLDNVMRDASGRVCIRDVVRRMVDMDLGKYRLIPCYRLDLNKEEVERWGRCGTMRPSDDACGAR